MKTEAEIKRLREKCRELDMDLSAVESREALTIPEMTSVAVAIYSSILTTAAISISYMALKMKEKR